MAVFPFESCPNIQEFFHRCCDCFQPMAQRQKAVVDDQELKSRIIARYSYVDKDDDVREHRPVGPKSVSIRDSFVLVSVQVTLVLTKRAMLWCINLYSARCTFKF